MAPPAEARHAAGGPPAAGVGRSGTAIGRECPDEAVARGRPAVPVEDYRRAFDSLGIATCLVSAEGRILRVNRAMCDLLGRRADDLLATNLRDLTHPDGAVPGAEVLAGLAAASASPQELLTGFVTGDGSLVWGQLSVSAVRDERGEVRFAVAQIVDTTERVRVERALAASEEFLRAVLDASRDSTMRMDRDLRVEFVNRKMVELSGREFRDWVGKTHLELGYPRDLVELWEGYARTVLETGEPLSYEFDIDNVAGEHQWFETSLAPIFDRDGVVSHVVATSRDITERQNAVAALGVLATHDPLTGLANRTAILDEITRAAGAGRREGLATAVILLDLDRFKDVNDAMGHEAGDRLLIDAAAVLSAKVRTGDLVGRLGGDEFVVVMRNLDDPGQAVDVARRVVEAFRSPFDVGGVPLYCTVSAGVTIAAEPRDSIDLLREADTAMYSAKSQGRDQVSVFNEDLRTAVTARLAVESDLHGALARGDMELWYQPEVDLSTGSVGAVEALLRWRHPSGEVWPAARFIDVAESTRMILEIGDWVLHQACAQGATWAAARPDAAPVVRVNMSALQIAEPDLMDTLDQALGSCGLDPALLCIEITETALLDGTTTVRHNLAGIHDRGIAIALDDFGTGYASLIYLARYPVDVIKIDRSFVATLSVGTHEDRLVAGIIALAAEIGVAVTAEGVETEDQVTRLAKLGCPSAQGYFYSAAVPADQITAVLERTYPHP